MPRRSLILLLLIVALTALPLTGIAQPTPTGAAPAAATLTAPQLTDPADGTVLPAVGPVTLTWEPPTGSTQVHLQVAPFNGDGPAVNLILNAEVRFVVPAPPTWYLLLPDMGYTWRVRATDKVTFAGEHDPAWGVWSAVRRFRTPAVPETTLAPVDPPDGGTVATTKPSLIWRDGSPATFYYEIQVSGDARFDTNPATATSFVWWNLVHGGVTQPPNSWETLTLGSNLPYFWRVRPRIQGDGVPAPWGATWRFGTAAVLSDEPMLPTPTPTAAPPTPTATPVPVLPTPTATPGIAANRIAFVSDRDGGFEVYAMNPNGSRVTRLTENDVLDSRPVWSPDGARIAWLQLKDSLNQVYVMQADGGNPVRLAPDATDQRDVSWSRDGNQLAFTSNGQINLVNADGGNRRALVASNTNSSSPLLSPNGQTVAFIRGQSLNYQVCLMAAADGGVSCFGSPGNYARDIAWSPDGSRILYSLRTTRSFQIWAVEAVAGNAPYRLTNNAFTETNPVWSPDGKVVAYVTDRDGNQNVYRMNADGTAQGQLTKSTGKDFGPIWSPDGKQIAFLSERNGNREIYVVNADGSGENNLTRDVAQDDSPSWALR
ncbi:MAG: hypothetical protein NTZ05_07485 [Chloroflexi bacterium]|nr:hypothetical protein [Chloroflexota bacterium]